MHDHIIVTVRGISPMLHNNGGAVDTTTVWAEEHKAISERKGTNRTTADATRLKQLDTLRALWLSVGNRPEVPAQAFRANIEHAARTLKQGPAVRQGLIALETDFRYDVERYGSTLDELQNTTQFTTPVNINRNRVMKTRAKFELPWEVDALFFFDDELVDVRKMERWLDIAGRRFGLGDWRPEKGGPFGRYKAIRIEATDAETLAEAVGTPTPEPSVNGASEAAANAQRLEMAAPYGS